MTRVPSTIGDYPSQEWVDRKKAYARTLSDDSLIWAIKDCFFAAEATFPDTGTKYAEEAIIYHCEYARRREEAAAAARHEAAANARYFVRPSA